MVAQPLLTLFSSPKPFRGSIDTIQRNAIASWRALGPEVEVLIMGDEEGAAEAAADLGARHVPDIERNDHGTPLVSAMFREAERQGGGQILSYIDGDIILLDDFLPALRRVMAVGRPFLMVGRRWDVDLQDRLAIEPGWQDRLRARVLDEGVVHGELGMDYFCFSRGAFRELPPFAVGRPCWDRWLIYHARRRKLLLVDASPSVLCVHQNHDYAHAGGSRDDVWSGPEAQENRRLAGGEPRMLSLQHATRLLTAEGLVRPLDAWHLLGRVAAAPSLHAWMRPLSLPVRAAKRALYVTHDARRRIGLVIEDPGVPTLRDSLRRG